MIPTLGEGLAQSLLPCSWTLILPAIALALGTRRAAVLAGFVAASIVTAWVAVAGWLLAPLWLAGLVLLIGAVLWWRLGAGHATAALVGMGAAWAWQPCVGPQLGNVLTTAQTDPGGALPGLAVFLAGVMVVGLGIGLMAGVLVGRWRTTPPVRVGAVVAGLLGLTMVLGLYSDIASVFARWSTALWA